MVNGTLHGNPVIAGGAFAEIAFVTVPVPVIWVPLNVTAKLQVIVLVIGAPAESVPIVVGPSRITACPAQLAASKVPARSLPTGSSHASTVPFTAMPTGESDAVPLKLAQFALLGVPKAKASVHAPAGEQATGVGVGVGVGVLDSDPPHAARARASTTARVAFR